MNKTKVFWAAAAVAVAFAVAPAKAALIDVTWTGSVISGNVGAAGAFGIQDQFAGNELAGQAFTATYRFDTTIGSLVQGAGFADLRGGSGFGDGSLPGPAVSATLTINGITVSFGNDAFGGYSRKSVDGVSDIYTEVDTSDADKLALRVFRFDQNIPFTGLDETLIYDIGGVGDLPQGVFQQLDGATLLFGGNLAPTRVTIAPFVENPGGGGGGVPEPASLALLGLGLMGLALERRRRRAV
jgi:hypothetical protein